VAAYLLAKGATLDIFRLVFLGDLPRVAALLADHPAWLNAEDPFDQIYFMPLIAFAVAGGQAEVADFLIGCGANLVQYSAQLLGLAAGAARLDLLALVLSNGADVRAVDSSIFVAVSDLAVMLCDSY
jgi:hypothetical protein